MFLFSFFLKRKTFPWPLCTKTHVLPSALSACGCSFEDGPCLWVQEPQPRVQWLSKSGDTDTPHTGPVGDHTSGSGGFFYEVLFNHCQSSCQQHQFNLFSSKLLWQQRCFSLGKSIKTTSKIKTVVSDLIGHQVKTLVLYLFQMYYMSWQKNNWISINVSISTCTAIG